jgi:FdhE protein
MSFSFSWEHRIERAQQLAEESSHAKQILAFYAEILKWQHALFTQLSVTHRQSLTGAFERDVGIILEHFGSLLNLVSRHGSESLSAQADRLNTANDKWRGLLTAWWNGESPAPNSFFAKVCLQPYLELLAQLNIPLIDSQIDKGSEGEQPNRHCPFCGRKPLLAILSDDPSISAPIAGGMEGGRRFLMCGDCLTLWHFPRIACPSCLESDPHKLPYYIAEEYPNLRVDSCETCKHYLKTIDMMKDRRLIPPVDELAAIPLDLWAVEQGYIKIQQNLAGI